MSETPTQEYPSPWNLAEREGFQKLDLKLFVTPNDSLGMDAYCDKMLSIFGRWRLEEGEEIIDLADYAHVPNGPGVLLVGHRWQFSFDWEGGAPGLWFSTRKNLTGSLAERLTQAIRGLLEKSARLLAEPELQGVVEPRLGELQVVVNDRMRYPNTDEADAAFRPAVDEVVGRLYDGAEAAVEREADPERRLGYRIQIPDLGKTTLAELLQRL